MKRVIVLIFALFMLTCDRDISTNPALSTMDISFQKYGGFAGIHNSLLIDSTGKVTSIMMQDTIYTEIDFHAHRELLALFDDFLSLDKAEYTTNHCADVFFYEIVLLETRTVNEIHSVLTEDCYLGEFANTWDRRYLIMLIKELQKLQNEIHQGDETEQ